MLSSYITTIPALIAMLLLHLGCSDSNSNSGALSDDNLRIEIMAGADQYGIPGEPFPKAIEFVVRSASGSIVPKVTIEFSKDDDSEPAAVLAHQALNTTLEGKAELHAIASEYSGISTKYKAAIRDTNVSVNFYLHTMDDSSLAALQEPERFEIITQNGNTEYAGFPFGVTIRAVTKAGLVATSYEGPKEIGLEFVQLSPDKRNFKPITADQVSPHPPVQPQPMTVTFEEGVATIKTGFEVRKIIPRMAIAVKPNADLPGRSDELTLLPGDLESIQVTLNRNYASLGQNGDPLRGERTKVESGKNILIPSVTPEELQKYPKTTLSSGDILMLSNRGYDKFSNPFDQAFPVMWSALDVGESLGTFPSIPIVHNTVAVRDEASEWNAFTAADQAMAVIEISVNYTKKDGSVKTVKGKSGVIHITSDVITNIAIDQIQLFRSDTVTPVGTNGVVNAGEQLYFTLTVKDYLGRPIIWQTSNIQTSFSTTGVSQNRDKNQLPVSLDSGASLKFCNGYAVSPFFDLAADCPKSGGLPNDSVCLAKFGSRCQHFIPLTFYSTHAVDPRVVASFEYNNQELSARSHAIDLQPGPLDHYTLRPGAGLPDIYFLDSDLKFIQYDGTPIVGKVFIYASDLYGNDTTDIPGTETDVRVHIATSSGTPYPNICEAGNTLDDCASETYFSCSSVNINAGVIGNCLDLSIDMIAHAGVVELENVLIDSPGSGYYIHVKSELPTGKSTFDPTATPDVFLKQIVDRAFNPSINCDFRCVNRFKLDFDNQQYTGQPFNIDVSIVDARSRLLRDDYLNGLASSYAITWHADLNANIKGNLPYERDGSGFLNSLTFSQGRASLNVMVNKPHHPIPLSRDIISFTMNGTLSAAENDLYVQQGSAYEYRIKAVDNSGVDLADPYYLNINADEGSKFNVRVESIDRGGNYVSVPANIELEPEKVSGNYANSGEFNGTRTCTLTPGVGYCTLNDLWYQVGNVVRVAVKDQIMDNSPHRLLIDFNVTGGTVADFRFESPETIKAWGGTPINNNSGSQGFIEAIDGAGNLLTDTPNADNFLNTTASFQTQNLAPGFPNQNACHSTITFTNGRAPCNFIVTRAGTIPSEMMRLNVTAPPRLAGINIPAVDANNDPVTITVVPNQPDYVYICTQEYINNFDGDPTNDCTSSLVTDSVRAGTNRSYYMVSFDAYGNSRGTDGGSWSIDSTSHPQMTHGGNIGDHFQLQSIANGTATFTPRGSIDNNTYVVLNANRNAEPGLAHITQRQITVTILPAAISHIAITSQSHSSASEPIMAALKNFQLLEITAYYMVDGQPWVKWDFGGAGGELLNFSTAGSTLNMNIPANFCATFTNGVAKDKKLCAPDPNDPPTFDLTMGENGNIMRISTSWYDPILGSTVPLTADSDPIWITANTPDRLVVISPDPLTVVAGIPFDLVIEPQDEFGNPTTINCGSNPLVFTRTNMPPSSPGGFGGGTSEAAKLFDDNDGLDANGHFTSSGNTLYAKTTHLVSNNLVFSACGLVDVTVPITVTQGPLNSAFLTTTGSPGRDDPPQSDANCQSTTPSTTSTAVTCPVVRSYFYDIYGNPFDNELNSVCNSWSWVPKNWTPGGGQNMTGTPTLTGTNLDGIFQNNRVVSHSSFIDGNLRCEHSDPVSGNTASAELPLWGGIIDMELVHNAQDPLEADEDNMVVSEITLYTQKQGVRTVDTGRNFNEIIEVNSNSVRFTYGVWLGLNNSYDYPVYTNCVFTAGVCSTPLTFDFIIVETGRYLDLSIRQITKRVDNIRIFPTDAHSLDLSEVNGTVQTGLPLGGRVVIRDRYNNLTGKNCGELEIIVPNTVAPDGISTASVPDPQLEQNATGYFTFNTTTGQDSQHIIYVTNGIQNTTFNACGLTGNKNINVIDGRVAYIALRKTDARPAFNANGMSDEEVPCTSVKTGYDYNQYQEVTRCDPVYAFFWDKYHNTVRTDYNDCTNWTYTPFDAAATPGWHADYYYFNNMYMWGAHTLEYTRVDNYVDGAIGCSMDDGAASIKAWGGITTTNAEFYRLETDGRETHPNNGYILLSEIEEESPIVLNAFEQNLRITKIEFFTKKDGVTVPFTYFNSTAFPIQYHWEPLAQNCYYDYYNVYCPPRLNQTGTLNCNITNGVCNTQYEFDFITMTDSPKLFKVGAFYEIKYTDDLRIKVDPGPADHLLIANITGRQMADPPISTLRLEAGQALGVTVHLRDKYNNITSKGCNPADITVSGGTTSRGENGTTATAAIMPTLTSFSATPGVWNFTGADSIYLYDARTVQTLNFSACSDGPETVDDIQQNITVKFSIPHSIYLRGADLSEGQPNAHSTTLDCEPANPATCTLYAFAWDAYGNWIPNINDESDIQGFLCPSWSWANNLPTTPTPGITVARHSFTITENNPLNHIEGAITCTAGARSSQTEIFAPIRKEPSISCSSWSCADLDQPVTTCTLENTLGSGYNISGTTYSSTNGSTSPGTPNPIVSAGSPLVYNATQQITLSATPGHNNPSFRLIADSATPALVIPIINRTLPGPVPMCNAADMFTAALVNPGNPFSCDGANAIIEVEVRNDLSADPMVIDGRTYSPDPQFYTVISSGCSPGTILEQGESCVDRFSQPDSGKSTTVNYSANSGAHTTQVTFPNSIACP